MDSRLVSPFLMWAIAFAGAGALLLVAPEVRIFESGIFGILLVLLALLNWLYFFLSALWKNHGAARSAAGVGKLVTTGIYSRVRHPIYFADIVLAWGAFLYLPKLAVLLAVCWLTVVLVFWARLEEGALERKFGEEYREYKRGVPMLVPRIQKAKF